MRKTYESKADRAAQIAIGKFISREWGVRFDNIGKRYYFCDALLSKHEGPAGRLVIEIKDRPGILWGQDVPISCSKISGLVAFASAFERIRTALVVRFEGLEVGYVFASDVGDDVYVGGRYDRGDPDDVELMVRIPASRFKLIGRMT